jgi:carbon-monoxide dehydrogenase medium subunit
MRTEESGAMKPSAFEYHAPATVREAVALLAELQDADAKVLAGGQSLIPVLAMRLAAFGHLIDIGRIAELKGVNGTGPDGGYLDIGAGTTQAAIGNDPAVRTGVPLLARATPLIAHFQIRNRGTIGGSVAHADPSAECPAVVLALDAEIEAASARGTRRIPARDFFTGVWSTALEPDELLTRIHFPVWRGRRGFAIKEIARRHGDFAVAGAVVAVLLDDQDRIARYAAALFGMGSTPIRALTAEAALIGASAADVDPGEAGRAAVAELDGVPSDLHGTADYRRKTGAVMVARALTAALREAQGGSH